MTMTMTMTTTIRKSYIRSGDDIILIRYIVLPNGCWEWLGSIGSHGYGQVTIDSKVQLVHRISFRQAKGPIPKGIKICHTCDFKPCINPDHLFSGTQKDNMMDASRKGRLGKATNNRGNWNGGRPPGRMPLNERVSRSKVNYEAAKVFRFFAGCRGYGRLLAALYRIAPQTISNIQKGRALSLKR